MIFYPIMFQSWVNVADRGPALNQRWLFAICNTNGLSTTFDSWNNSWASVTNNIFIQISFSTSIKI